MAGEKGKAGAIAESAGDFLAKAAHRWEQGKYLVLPWSLEGVGWWIHKSFESGAYATGFWGGLGAALGFTFAREFITGGSGH